MSVTRGVGWAVRETLLTLAAALGALCIVLVILAQFAHVTLILFSTGSMSPTIPAGSVALVRQIPASEIAIGDVMTIDRAGQLPVTHRVTSVAAGPTPAERTITMRGDANDAEDPAPYVVTQGRIVLGSVPGLAHVIVWLSSPWVLGGLTLSAAALVMWAFWPRGEPRQAAPRKRASRASHAAVAAVGLACAGALVTIHSVPAQATPQPELSVTSDLGGGNLALAPGEQVQWHVTADASGAPAGGQLAVAFAGEGDAALGMSVAVRSCAVAWVAASCPSGERLLRGSLPAPLAEEESLLTLPTPVTSFLQLSVEVLPFAAATGDEQVSLRVMATAGDVTGEVSLGGIGGLASTGAAPLSGGLYAAPAAIGLGLLLAGTATVSRSRSRKLAASAGTAEVVAR